MKHDFRLPKADFTTVGACKNCAINSSCYNDQVNPWWPNKCGPLSTFHISGGGDYVAECLLGRPLVMMGDSRLQYYFASFWRLYLGKVAHVMVCNH